MAFDESTLSPQARAGYVRIGRSVGCMAALAQANKTLGALAIHGAELVRHGFGSPDTQMLTDARDALQVEHVGRGVEVTGKRVSRSAVKTALERAAAERDAARTILEGAHATLVQTGDAAAASKVEAALKLTAVAPARKANLVADQLEHLHAALTDPDVAPAAADRGGPEAAVDLAAIIATLRAAVQKRKGGPGAPMATERLNLLEGVAVTLARRAHKAARAAGRRLGKPALAVEFDLTHLRSRSSSRPATAAPKVDAPKVDAPKAPAPVTAPEATPA